MLPPELWTLSRRAQPGPAASAHRRPFPRRHEPKAAGPTDTTGEALWAARGPRLGTVARWLRAELRDFSLPLHSLNSCPLFQYSHFLSGFKINNKNLEVGMTQFSMRTFSSVVIS